MSLSSCDKSGIKLPSGFEPISYSVDNDEIYAVMYKTNFKSQLPCRHLKRSKRVISLVLQ